MEKINVAELLKDAPKGMKLDCTIWDNVEFDHIDMTRDYPIYITIGQPDSEQHTEHLTKYGQWDDNPNAKCVILPKGKTTWEGFVLPCEFKNGDVIYIKDKYNQEWCSILDKCENDKLYTYVDLCLNDNKFYHGILKLQCYCKDIIEHRFATEKEKQKLFDAIKANGYKWNNTTKKLEKLSKSYKEEVSNKFDITTLVPFDKVLVRDNDVERWRPTFWGFYDNDDAMNYPYECVGDAFAQCIPYEGNEHLRGTNNKCDDFYKTWE